MKSAVSAFVLLIAVAMIASQANSESTERSGTQTDNETILFSYRGNYKMTPAATLHSDLARIVVESVELLEGPHKKPATKIAYKPLYGKIDAESAAFRTKHETQNVTMLLNGDHTANVKKDDILRSCYYPN